MIFKLTIPTTPPIVLECDGEVLSENEGHLGNNGSYFFKCIIRVKVDAETFTYNFQRITLSNDKFSHDEFYLLKKEKGYYVTLESEDIKLFEFLP